MATGRHPADRGSYTGRGTFQHRCSSLLESAGSTRIRKGVHIREERDDEKDGIGQNDAHEDRRINLGSTEDCRLQHDARRLECRDASVEGEGIFNIINCKQLRLATATCDLSAVELDGKQSMTADGQSGLAFHYREGSNDKLYHDGSSDKEWPQRW